MSKRILTHYYSVKLTAPFSACDGRNYVLDLPKEESGESIVIKSPFFLEDGDMLKLPKGSWLEIIKDENPCFGCEAKLFGTLEFLDYTTHIKEDICNKREAGYVYQTIATYIR